MYKYASQHKVSKKRKTKRSGVRKMHSSYKIAPFREMGNKIILAGLACLILLVIWQAVAHGPFLVSMFSTNPKVGAITREPITWVVDYGDIALVTHDPIANTVTAITLPGDTSVTLPNNLGRFRISALFDVGELKKSGDGGELLKQGAQYVFNVPVDGYMKISLTKALDMSDTTALKQQLASIIMPLKLIKTRNFEKQLKTDLKTGDLFALWWQMRQVRFDKITLISGEKALSAAGVELADGSKVLGISEDKLDNLIGDNFVLAPVAKESATVAVLNASGVYGEGSRYAKMLENVGANVIKVEGAEKELGVSQLVVRDEAQTRETVKRLLKLRQFTIINAQNDTANIEDITVILGKQ